mmetsp:Transcript_13105/g.33149  ORF Transcript_13105/g.33149 Transcript_13105/m.33149 type:complete len:218 (-) Transcript_13105:347-1000(-)
MWMDNAQAAAGSDAVASATAHSEEGGPEAAARAKERYNAFMSRLAQVRGRTETAYGKCAAARSQKSESDSALGSAQDRHAAAQTAVAEAKASGDDGARAAAAAELVNAKSHLDAAMGAAEAAGLEERTLAAALEEEQTASLAAVAAAQAEAQEWAASARDALTASLDDHQVWPASAPVASPKGGPAPLVSARPTADCGCVRADIGALMGGCQSHAGG